MFWICIDLVTTLLDGGHYAGYQSISIVCCKPNRTLIYPSACRHTAWIRTGPDSASTPRPTETTHNSTAEPNNVCSRCQSILELDRAGSLLGSLFLWVFGGMPAT